MESLANRLTTTDTDLQHAATLAEVDEGIEVLEERDHKEVKNVLREHENETTERMNFSRAYQAKRVSIRTAAASTQRSGKQRKGQQSNSELSRRPLPNTISQQEAKSFIPPGSSVWRSNTRYSWNAHVPPRARISEAWAKHGGDQQALKCLLRRMWRQHCELQGLPESQCPWKFDDQEPAPNGAASSSGPVA